MTDHIAPPGQGSGVCALASAAHNRLAGCPKDGTVLDPFGGAGTTGLVADRLGRNAVLIELNPEYAEIARNRLASDGGMFADVKVAA